jgi:uncharacterized DUF497 family protein
MLRFDWDEHKNRANRRKHGIWFEEAQSAFDDPSARLFDARSIRMGKSDWSFSASAPRPDCWL